MREVDNHRRALNCAIADRRALRMPDLQQVCLCNMAKNARHESPVVHRTNPRLTPYSVSAVLSLNRTADGFSKVSVP